jgi:hypothetical protein
VIKIEYRRALQQRPIALCCRPLFPSFPATNNRSVSSSPATLTGLPSAFAAQRSPRSSAFLPGTAQCVESDVTHSKQTPGRFLPGARTARRPFRLPSKIVNSASLACPDVGRPTAFLTGSASHSRSSVTHSKQSTEPFLTGSRIASEPLQQTSIITEKTSSLVVSFAVGPRKKRRAIPVRGTGSPFNVAHACREARRAFRGEEVAETGLRDTANKLRSVQ